METIEEQRRKNVPRGTLRNDHTMQSINLNRPQPVYSIQGPRSDAVAQEQVVAEAAARAAQARYEQTTGMDSRTGQPLPNAPFSEAERISRQLEEQAYLAELSRRGKLRSMTPTQRAAMLDERLLADTMATRTGGQPEAERVSIKVPTGATYDEMEHVDRQVYSPALRAFVQKGRQEIPGAISKLMSGVDQTSFRSLQDFEDFINNDETVKRYSGYLDGTIYDLATRYLSPTMKGQFEANNATFQSFADWYDKNKGPNDFLSADFIWENRNKDEKLSPRAREVVRRFDNDPSAVKYDPDPAKPGGIVQRNQTGLLRKQQSDEANRIRAEEQAAADQERAATKTEQDQAALRARKRELREGDWNATAKQIEKIDEEVNKIDEAIAEQSARLGSMSTSPDDKNAISSKIRAMEARKVALARARTDLQPKLDEANKLRERIRSAYEALDDPDPQIQKMARDYLKKHGEL